jgi:glutaredoxin
MNVFQEPSQLPNKFTIYTKSGCIYCIKVKQLLSNHNFEYIEINCDSYLIHNKPLFLEFLQSYTHMEWKTFPFVFYKQNFIGGFTETQQYINNLVLQFDNEF